MKLNEIRDNYGSTHYKKRLGRGIGSGLGKTSGRGHKGQKARGSVAPGFEGGQNPLYRRMPKRGFNNYNAKNYFVINVGSIQTFIDEKRIDSAKTLELSYLLELGIAKGYYDGFRVLGTGELKDKISVKADHVTGSAKEAITKAGGSVEVIEKKDKSLKKKDS